MRTKRKRAGKKTPAKKSAALPKNVKPVNQSEKALNQSEEAFLAFINQTKEDSVSANSNVLEVVDKYDSSSSSSSSDSDDESQLAHRRLRKSTKLHGNEKHTASELPKKGRKGDVRSSKGLRSSSRKQDEFQMPRMDPRYNKNELKAALEVIKNIMKMDEAQPFNVPVAAGTPGYYTVIETPMDFGTICNNLESSIKYMNSEDVFNDIQYIWENCCKYNKKGEYIVYLMKRVKKKFMKYWTASGLSITQSRKVNVGTSYKASKTDYAARHSGFEPFYLMGHAVEGASQMHQDRLGFIQPYLCLPPCNYSQPPASTAWPQFSHLPPVSFHQHCQSHHPQPSTNQPQFPQLQACMGCSSAGYSYLQSPKVMAPKEKKHESSSKHKNEAMVHAASICGGAPSHSHEPQPYVLRQQQRLVQLQPSQLHAAADGDMTPRHKRHASTTKHKKNLSMGAASIHGGPPDHSRTHSQAVADGGKSYLPPQANYTRSIGSGILYHADPMVFPGHSHPQQYSPLSHGESSESQQLHSEASDCQPQSSQLQDNMDIEHSHVSLTDSASRGNECAFQYSAHPTTNKFNKENKDKLASEKLQPEQTPQIPEQPQLLTKKRRGRGPTYCRFLNDLTDGERIFVKFNKSGQPVGPESSKLTRFLGTVARNGHKAPLNFVHWRAMLVSYKEEMWEYVQTKFSLDPSGKSWVMKSIAKKWRDWRAELKAMYYDSFNTDEERLQVRDSRIVPDQWPFLISYWSSDDTKRKCAKNKANSLKQRSLRTSGTKSYANILEEERNKRPDGKEPTRAELYILTHTRKNGQPVDEIAAEIISKIREEKAKKDTTSHCSDESNDTLCLVMGEKKHNRVRPSRDDLVRMASDAKKSADEKVHKMEVKLGAMEEKYARMENHIARMTSNMEKFLEKLGGSSNILGIEQAADPEKDDDDA